MALDENDIAKIGEIFRDAMNKTGAGGDGNGAGGDGNGNDLNTDKIKADAAAAKENECVLKSAMAFNINKDKFLEDNKSFIPESVLTIFKAYSDKTYANELEQADNYRKVIIDEIFSEQKNIDVMPESAKARIQKYKALAESDKLGAAGKYFDLVDTFLTIQKGKAQVAFNKTNPSGDDEYSEKFKKLGENFTKKGV